MLCRLTTPNVERRVFLAEEQQNPEAGVDVRRKNHLLYFQ